MYMLYEKSNGKIFASVSCPSTEIDFYITETVDAKEGIEDGNNYYILNNEVVERPPNPITINKTALMADGVDEIIFTEVPPNTKLKIFQYTPEDYYEYDLLEGTDTFSTTISSTYLIMIESFPYKDMEITINAS